MKRTLIFSLFLLLGFAVTYGQQQHKDSVKLHSTDSISAYSKLSADQIYDLEEGKLKIQKLRNQPPWESAPAVIVPVTVFTSIVLFTLIIFSFQHKIKKSRNELIIKYAELGKELPKELLMGTSRKISNINRGIILISLGASLMIALRLIIPGEHPIWSLGIIPFFIGIGYLIVYFVEKKSKQNNESTR